MTRHNSALFRSSQKAGQHSSNLVFIYLLAGISLLVAVFLFVQPASAQTDEGQASAEVVTEESGDESSGESEDQSAQTEDASTDESSTEQIDTSTTDPEVLAEADQAAQDAVAEDETVTYEDLDATVPAILPDNPLYAFKRWGRSIRKAFTFNPVRKLELDVQYANQELADAQQLIEEKGDDPDAVEDASRAVERFERSLAQARERAGNIANQAGERLVENIIDKQIKHQKVLDKIEERVLNSDAPEEIKDRVFNRINNAKERSADHVANAISRIEQNSDRLAERIGNALRNQQGSDFKELRHLEILDRLEDHVGEEAREAFKKAEERARQQFQQNISNLPEEVRRLQFERYANHLRGDEARHLEVFDELKNSGVLPEDIRAELERAKDVAAQRFKERLESFDDQFADQAVAERLRARALEHFNSEDGVDVGKLRALDEIRKRTQFEDQKLRQELDRRRDESVDAFITEIQKVKGEGSDAAGELTTAANEFRRLSREIAENPNPTAFRLLDELEARVKADPDAREILSRIERDTKQRFVERSTEEGDRFINSVITNNPEDLEVFRRLQQDFRNNPNDFAGPRPFDGGSQIPGQPPAGVAPPSNLDQVFNKVIRVHANGVTEHVNNINDPVLLENFQRRIEQAPPQVLQDIRNNSGIDVRQFAERRREFIADENNRRPQFLGPPDRQGGPDIRPDVRPPTNVQDAERLRQQINQIQPNRPRPQEVRPNDVRPPNQVRPSQPDRPPQPNVQRPDNNVQRLNDDRPAVRPNQPNNNQPRFDAVRPNDRPATDRPPQNLNNRRPGNQPNVRPNQNQQPRPQPNTFNRAPGSGNDQRGSGALTPLRGSVNQRPPSPPPNGGVRPQSVSALYDRARSTPVASQSRVLRLISTLFGYERTYAR